MVTVVPTLLYSFIYSFMHRFSIVYRSMHSARQLHASEQYHHFILKLIYCWIYMLVQCAHFV